MAHHATITSGFHVFPTKDAAALRAEAVSAAADADVAVVFAGLSDREESEGFDRTTLDLPAVQVELIRSVAAASRRTVVVLSNGGVVSLEGWHDDIDAIVEGFLLGQAGGAALADVLFGVVNPSGHLAETIPLRLEDTPSFLTFPGEQGHVRYGEGVMVGYRGYATLGRPVRYAFGHGLSYTTFAATDLTVEPTGPDTARVSVAVTNTGARAGKHLVQVYVGTSAGPVRRPARELRAFAKVALEPGESRTVRFDLDRRAFAYYDVLEGGWVVAPGAYAVQIGESALDVVAAAELSLAGDDIVPVLTLDSSVAEWFGHPVTGADMLQLFQDGMPAGVAEAGGDASLLMTMVGSMPMRRFLADMGEFIPVRELEQLIAVAAAARRNRTA
jgi:beta-glucosidase